MKKYNSSWNAEEMQINFNQKQWRQDLAAFIRDKYHWPLARVTRAKTIESKTTYNSCIKEFEIFDEFEGNVFVIRYTNKNEITSTSNDEYIKAYFKVRTFS